ncbi:MAG: dephospho-CoA kinase [Deltaproteobacteria bacterium]|nr:MAG: dephospho-CoA kinase [Deltaproteobacteria bacterium]
MAPPSPPGGRRQKGRHHPMPRSMEVYGLTGGIGSGKSTVAALLQDYGIPVVSADELSRIVVAPGTEGLDRVVEAFGPGVLDDEGRLDRAKLAAEVFADPERRRKLESILHPLIRDRYEQVLDALEKAGHPVVVYEVPLLFEKGLQGDMKGVILVTASDDLRVRRVMERDGTTEAHVRARMAAQMPEAEKRARADYVVENDGDLDDLRREVQFLVSRYLRVDDAPARPVLERSAPALPTSPAKGSPPPPTSASGSDDGQDGARARTTPLPPPAAKVERPPSTPSPPSTPVGARPPPPPPAAKGPERQPRVPPPPPDPPRAGVPGHLPESERMTEPGIPVRDEGDT